MSTDVVRAVVVVLADALKKELKRKERHKERRKKLWVKSWIERRDKFGASSSLLKELRN